VVSEEKALELLTAGDVRGASTAILELYGAEVCGYVLSLVREQDDAAEAFSQATEDLFRNLPGFRRESSLRTWFYTIARHAAYRQLKQRTRRRGLPASISELGDVLEAAVRTATAAYQKSEVKNAVAELRNSLSEDERELLALRVDRNLSWDEVALILLGPEANPTPLDVKRATARARKQFERVKEKLRELARESGLLDS
jgi:RNA polymerase sigma-70 factor, ECF subfamily